jgi:uncharacterized repeat protein (TIGR01451 family)
MSRAARPMLWLGLAVLVILGPREKAQTAGYDRGAALPARQLKLAERYGKLPLTFEANRGQTDRRVQFLARGDGYALFLTPTEAVMSLHGPGDPHRFNPQSSGLDKPMSLTSKSAAVLRMTLVGSNPKASTMGLEELSGRSNYFIGRDPKQWRTNVPNYGRIRFADVYRGVDLVYYGDQRQLEYDFVVAPGADPSAITLGFAGAQRLEIDAQGELALKTGAGEVRWHKPVLYQDVDGVRRTVNGQYVRKGESSVGFEVASYDPRLALVIDPILDYSTYLGGSGSEVGNAIAVDADGNAYVAGTTLSTDFPVKAGAFQTIGTGYDAFVVKVNSAGFRAYATYLGGADVDTGAGIAVDALGNAYVAGVTKSLAFPVTPSAYQTAYQGGPGRLDAYVTKLNAAGNGLLYSTYLGGDHDDVPAGIAVDSSNPPNGLVYVTGFTTSMNFPTLNAFLGAGLGSGFVTALNTALSGVNSLVYSTYIDTDRGRAIAADSSGNVYVTGELTCTDPIVVGCGVSNTSPFVTKILTTESGILSLIYQRILDARSDQTSVGTGIAVDSAVPPNVYVTGYTNALGFPGAAVSPIQSANRGGNDAFVAKLDDAGTVVYYTFLGGSGDDQGNAIAVDGSGNIYVTGQTSSVDFPLANAIQSNYNGGPLDAFVAKINATGSALVYSTYLGGGGSDWGAGIAADSSGSAYVTGGTSSFNFPVNSFQFSLNGSQDAFVAKIVDDTPPAALPPTIAKAFGANSIPFGANTTLSFTLGNPNSTSLTGVAFTDPLPAGMIVATPSGLTGSCGGVVTATAGSGSISLTSGSLPANGSCTISVTVTGVNAGSWTNITGNIASDQGGSGSMASATLTVQNPLPPTIAKTFGASALPIGGTTSLTFTLGNPNSAPLTGVGFSDPLPAGLVVSTPNGLSSSTCGGTMTAVAGSSSVILSGATLTANANCSFSVNVTARTTGSWTNVTGNVTSVEGGSGGTASATLTVQNPLPPTIAKAFGTATLPLGGTTSLTFSLRNPNSAPLTGVGFSDPLPAGLIVSTPNGLSASTCGGTITAVAGSSSVTWSGGTLAPNTSCGFSVNVTAQMTGSWTNITGNVTSAEGGSGGTASAALTVQNPTLDCHGLRLRALIQTYGNLRNAARALGFRSVEALLIAIIEQCWLGRP